MLAFGNNLSFTNLNIRVGAARIKCPQAVFRGVGATLPSKKRNKCEINDMSCLKSYILKVVFILTIETNPNICELFVYMSEKA